MKNPITQEKFIEILNNLYDKAVNGDEKKYFDSAEKLGEKFMKKYSDKKTSCEKLIMSEIKKTSTSGFFASIGGIITMPITVPADMYVTFLVEIRMILSIAYIGGYDVKSPELKTIVYAILLGKDVKDIFIKSGIKPLGKHLTLSLVKEIPAKVLIGINKKIGIVLFAKFGGKGLIEVGLAVPIIGGIIGGGINFYFTKRRGKQSIETFILE